jgi:hypothetical protein
MSQLNTANASQISKSWPIGPIAAVRGTARVPEKHESGGQKLNKAEDGIIHPLRRHGE